MTAIGNPKHVNLDEKKVRLREEEMVFYIQEITSETKNVADINTENVVGVTGHIWSSLQMATMSQDYPVFFIQNLVSRLCMST